jgi:hypothetical protein
LVGIWRTDICGIVVAGIKPEDGPAPIEADEKGVLHQDGWCYSNEVGSNCMKKVFLIVTLSLFGVTAVFTAPPGSVAFAQRKEKDDKKNPPGPPVIKDKGSHDKPKEPPPKKDRKPS